MEELATQIIFYVFAGLVVASAALVVLGPNLVHSAFALLATFFGVAVFYVLLGADFLAGAQVLIYVGGILILLLFGVMLTHRIYGAELQTETIQFWPGLAVVSSRFGDARRHHLQHALETYGVRDVRRTHHRKHR